MERWGHERLLLIENPNPTHLIGRLGLDEHVHEQGDHGHRHTSIVERHVGDIALWMDGVERCERRGSTNQASPRSERSGRLTHHAIIHHKTPR